MSVLYINNKNKIILLMNFFFCIIILIGSIHPSLGNDFSSGQNLSKIDHIQQLIQKLRGTMEQGADWTNQSYSLMGLLLLEECKMVESVEIPAKISDNQLKLEVDRNCAALKSGKLLNNKSVITDKMALALQTDGQKMVAHLKRIENEKQITLDGMHGTLVEIFSQAQEHTESKKLQLFVVLFKILRQKIVEMSAGPAKNAIQTVLAQNSVAMPSEMLQLAFQFWQIHSHNLHDQPQIRLEHPRSRRKRRHGERRLIFDAAMFFMVFMITSSLVEFLKEVLGKVDEFLEFKMIVFVLALFIFAFIRQQPFVQKLASLVVSNVTKLKQE